MGGIHGIVYITFSVSLKWRYKAMVNSNICHDLNVSSAFSNFIWQEIWTSDGGRVRLIQTSDITHWGKTYTICSHSLSLNHVDSTLVNTSSHGYLTIVLECYYPFII